MSCFQFQKLPNGWAVYPFGLFGRGYTKAECVRQKSEGAPWSQNLKYCAFLKAALASRTAAPNSLPLGAVNRPRVTSKQKAGRLRQMIDVLTESRGQTTAQPAANEGAMQNIFNDGSRRQDQFFCRGCGKPFIDS